SEMMATWMGFGGGASGRMGVGCWMGMGKEDMGRLISPPRWSYCKLQTNEPMQIANANYSTLQSTEAKKFAPSTLAGRANQSIHVIQVALEGAASCGRQPVFCFGQTPVEGFGADDIVGFFQLPRVDTQVAVGGLEHSL